MAEFNYHQPVLLKEVLSFVIPERKITFVDLTLGRGGHSSKVLEKIRKGSSFYGVDRDPQALSYCKTFLKPYAKKASLHYLHARFSQAPNLLRSMGVTGADFILLDIGVSSPQFDDPSRGFSYRFNAPLDMRMDEGDTLTAATIINTYDERNLCRVFRELGQCHVYYPVVRKILAARAVAPIKTTFELVDIIKSGLPRKELNQPGHPAKQFFLGLRYEVNGEIQELQEGLKSAIDFLNPKGRLVIIAFNSEEDKIVKDIFRSYTARPVTDKYHPLLDEKEPDYIALTKKPLIPTDEEIADNNRSKAAIMRAIEKKG
jgi:16S rRNA (cytosine1402-N4)-methyltransferase